MFGSGLNFKVVVKGRNEFNDLLFHILNYSTNFGSYPLLRSFK